MLVISLCSVSGDLWSGWSGGDWPPTQAGMGWGWGWPVDSYTQGAGTSAPDLPPHQYNTNNVSQWPPVAVSIKNSYKDLFVVDLPFCSK